MIRRGQASVVRPCGYPDTPTSVHCQGLAGDQGGGGRGQEEDSGGHLLRSARSTQGMEDSALVHVGRGLLLVAVGINPQLPAGLLPSHHHRELVLDTVTALELFQALEEPGDLEPVVVDHRLVGVEVGPGVEVILLHVDRSVSRHDWRVILKQVMIIPAAGK